MLSPLDKVQINIFLACFASKFLLVICFVHNHYAVYLILFNITFLGICFVNQEKTGVFQTKNKFQNELTDCTSKGSAVAQW